MRLGGKGEEKDPPGRQAVAAAAAAAAVTKQGKSGGRLPLLFPPPPLDPLSPTQLCKLGAVRHTASLHWMPVCAAKCVIMQQVAVSGGCRVQLREFRVHVSQTHTGRVHSLSIHGGTCRTLQCMPQLDLEEPEKLLGGEGLTGG